MKKTLLLILLFFSTALTLPIASPIAQYQRTLNIYSNGPVVEYSMWHNGTYFQGETLAGGSVNINFPHYKPFFMTLYRADKLGWLLGRENDNFLAVATRTATATANMNDSTVQVLLDVYGLGVVRDTGNPGLSHTLAIYSSGGDFLEYSIWYEATYSQGEVSPGGTVNIDFPHYRSFMLTIARHDKICWLFCRENNNILTISYIGTTASADMKSTMSKTLLDVLGLGGVRTVGGTPQPRNLVIYSSTSDIVEYSLWYGTTYIQGETPAGGSFNLNFPHYRSFILTISRHEQIGWIFGRENDDQLAIAALSTTGSANIADSIGTTLLDVPGLGGIRDIAASTTKLSVTVNVNKAAFMPGELVSIDGVVSNATSGSPVFNATINTLVVNQFGYTVHATVQASDRAGTYSNSFTLDLSASAGTYTIYVTAKKYNVTSRYNFQDCRRQAVFSVGTSSTPTIVITRVYTSDPAGNAKTKFDPGSAVVVWITAQNTGADLVNGWIWVEVDDPNGMPISVQSQAATLKRGDATTPGFTVTLPRNALSGTYIVRGYVSDKLIQQGGVFLADNDVSFTV